MSRAKKICVLGDYSVGKTSLVRRYVLNEFSIDYLATVGVKAYQYRDQIAFADESLEIEQSIWDIEGSRFGEQLMTSYILGSSGALVVGDVTRDNATISMASHASKFLNILPGRPVVFALNKADLLPSSKWPDSAGLAREFGGRVIHTSAMTGKEVTVLFRAMLHRIIEIGA